MPQLKLTNQPAIQWWVSPRGPPDKAALMIDCVRSVFAPELMSRPTRCIVGIDLDADGHQPGQACATFATRRSPDRSDAGRAAAETPPSGRRRTRDAYRSAYHPPHATATATARRRTMRPLTPRRRHEPDVNGMEEVKRFESPEAPPTSTAA